MRARLCRRCRLPQVISDDHDRQCTWHPRNRTPVLGWDSSMTESDKDERARRDLAEAGLDFDEIVEMCLNGHHEKAYNLVEQGIKRTATEECPDQECDCRAFIGRKD